LLHHQVTARHLLDAFFKAFIFCNTMKIKTLIFLFILFSGFTLYCQTTRLTLLPVNKINEPAPLGTAVLYRLPDSLIIATKTTKDKLFFEVNVHTAYYLKMTAFGMQPIEQFVFVEDSALTLSINWLPKTSNLGNVTVVARKPLIKQEEDKTIVDAEVLANSSSNAYEVLEKTPGTVVDQEGNVYLNSTTPATVFINGREMKLSSADLASLLKSLPAGSVSKIEILRSPSAKYDAASSGGVINIVLKKGVKIGSSGSVNLSYFQGVYSTQTVGMNLNKSAGKINSYFSYQVTNRNNFEELSSERFIKTDSSLLSQKAFTTYPSLNNYVGAGMDWAFTKKFNVGYDLRISNNNGKSDAVNSIDIYKTANQTLLGKNQSDINNKNNSLYIGNNISSKYKIDSSGSEWTLELDYNFYRGNNTQEYSNFIYLPSGPTVMGDGKTNNKKHIYVAQSDLTLKLPQKITLETGLKITLSNSRNGSAYFNQKGSGPKEIDSFQTNTFKYKEIISAAYLQIARTFYGFTLKPGIRLETTHISGRQIIPKDTTLSINRTDVFPYVYLRHKLFKMFGFPLIANALYRRSIKRPYYEILNPYPKYVDQYLFDVGNPQLQPQFTSNYEVNVTFDDFPVFALGINETKDIFSNVTYQDDVTKIAYRTYDNLGKNKEYYYRIVGGIPPGGKYFFYAGAQHNFNKYNGFYQNQPLLYNRGSWLFFMYHEFKFAKTLTLNVQGFMRTKALQNFYELDNFGGLYFSANKSIFNKKANLILSFNDLLKTNQVSFQLNQGNVNAQGSRINDTRKIGLSFRYNFGLTKPKENNSFGTPVEGKEN
jgi:iron complex outermembrane recepter protein